MCTLVVIHRTIPGRWLVVAANRDEYLDRPAEGPALRSVGASQVIAPLDIKAGGTWLGLNKEGVFAALTNLRDPNPDTTRLTRGRVVSDSLRCESAAEAADRLMSIEAGVHNPFNAFVADREHAYLVGYRETPVLHQLQPGVHVVGNVDVEKPGTSEGGSGKVDRVRENAERISRLPAGAVLDSLADLCRVHGEEESPLEDICVHVGDAYGTRSSLLLELTERFFASENSTKERHKGGSAQIESPGLHHGASRLLYADGPPCVAPFKDFSPLLEELRQSPSYAPADFA